MKRHVLKALGVSLTATLGLMAFFASGAQAENLSSGGVAGKFKVLGSEALATEVPIVGAVLASKLLIASKNAYIECIGGTIKAGSKIKNSSEALAVVLFEGCATFEDKTKAVIAACDILGEPTSTGKIEAIGVALPKLHEGELYVLFEPEPERSFATIKFGEECGIGVKVNISGSFVGKVDNGNEASDHLISFTEAIQKLFQFNGVGDKILYGSAEAFVEGVVHLSLGGENPAHKGKNWSVV
jgi:hypothetical protein